MDKASLRNGSTGLRPRLLVVALAGGLVLACGGDAAAKSIKSGDVTVEMYDNRFQYEEIEIPVGGQVTWIGAGRNAHNAVSADGSWSTEDGFGSLEQLEGDDAVLVYNQPGEYTFFCTFHGNRDGDGMAGVLIVGDGG